MTGPDEFVTVSAGVIPLLLIAMLTDPISRQDAQHPVHRVFASLPLTLGIVAAVAAEAAALQAVLTEPTSSTVTVIDYGYIAMTAVVIVPRFAELFFAPYPDVARRVAQRLVLPALGVGGFGYIAVRIWTNSESATAARIYVLVLLAPALVTLLLQVGRTIRFAREEVRALGNPTSSGPSHVPASNSVVRCPTCQSDAVRALRSRSQSSLRSTRARLYAKAFGQFECESCGYLW
jgi:hypothetical protein